jgi:hypothetical protein
MRTHVTDYLLYRWRYVLGYLFIIAVLTTLISFASLYVPGALREQEITASLKSGALSVHSLDPSMVIDLPYHILQRFSFMLFGISIVSIKLPSIILGVLTALGIFLLIRTWFRRNVAVLVTILAVTSAPFLLMVQDGTPDIMYSFLTIWILFASTYVTRRKTFGTLWKVLAGVFMAMSLYTPLGIYLVIAVLTTAFFHPHIRYTIRKFSRPRLWIAVILGLISLVPLVYASAIDRDTLFTLLGIPLGQLHLKENILQVLATLIGFIPNHSSYILQPLYSLGFLLLAVVGVYKLITYKYTARSYITLTLAVLMIPLVIFNPNRIMYLFPLICLMVALGIATLITDWYKLFPRNPYARVAGLVPLAILVLGITYSGAARYMNNYAYNPQILSYYSNDLKLFNRELATKDKPTVAVVSREEVPFYSLVAAYDKRFHVLATVPSNDATIIVSRAAYKNTRSPLKDAELRQIVTNRFANESDRFYIYKLATK